MTITKRLFTLSFCGTLLALSACGADNPKMIERNILDAQKQVLGTVKLTDLGKQGTAVYVELRGLDGAGMHAVHFHETGDCSAPDFASAGGHYNPENVSHGTVSGGPHAGDMKNIEVNENGFGSLAIVNERVSLYGEDGVPALFDGDGSALIVHQKADDFRSQPSGAAGPRIGCALINE